MLVDRFGRIWLGCGTQICAVQQGRVDSWGTQAGVPEDTWRSWLVDRDGRLLNVNADTFAGHLAAELGAARLVIAGTTAGVLDGAGATLPALDGDAMAALIDEGTATAGMIAKLRACAHAIAGGVDDVVIVDGRDREELEAAADGAPRRATRVTRTAAMKR